jgi:membrane associated rhomboid family serine protease
MFILFMPLYFTIFCMYRWRSSNVGFFRNIYEFARDNLTFISAPVVTNKETYKNSAWVTYTLILVNEIIFYFVQPAYPAMEKYLLFIPPVHEWWSLPFALISCMFMHGDDFHLWGNMMFLWAVGTVVERRIGWKLFIGGYLLSGMLASLLAADIHYYFLDSELHALGASGAISGIMGIFMIRCYFKQMVFPIPIFGILPISFKIRMNSMAVIGLFFALDVQAGYGQISGEDQSHIAHWAHVGGMYAGMLLAARRRLQTDADLERHEEMGMGVLENGTLTSASYDNMIGLDAAELSLRKVLATRPDDVKLMLQLARTRSHYVDDPEARELYDKVLTKMVKAKPTEATALYREYYKKFMGIVSPDTQYRIVPHLLKEGNYQLASRSLELIIEHPETSVNLKEKAMYNCARVFDEMNLPHAAEQMRDRFLDCFPASETAKKIRAILQAK